MPSPSLCPREMIVTLSNLPKMAIHGHHRSISVYGAVKARNHDTSQLSLVPHRSCRPRPLLRPLPLYYFVSFVKARPSPFHPRHTRLMQATSSSARRKRKPPAKFTVHSDADVDVDDVDCGPTVQAVHVSLGSTKKRPTVTISVVPTQAPQTPSIAKDDVSFHPPQEKAKPKTKTRVVRSPTLLS